MKGRKKFFFIFLKIFLFPIWE